MSDINHEPEPAKAGDPLATEDFFAKVYEELRRIAAIQLTRGPEGQTLQPTALVHEAWLRLTAGDPRSWHGRAHFIAAASEAMRRILVDRARAKFRQKRGHPRDRAVFDESNLISPVTDEQLLEVHHALSQLEAEAPDLAQVVKLRFFGGLNHDEVDALLGINERTVRRRWELARVGLFGRIQESRNPSG